jgi:hypothetical protein
MLFPACFVVTLGNWDSVVGIATGYGLDYRGFGFRVPIGSGIFSMSSGPALGSTQAPIQWVLGALSSGIKWPGRETDHSPPASPEAKKIWIRLHGVVLAFLPLPCSYFMDYFHSFKTESRS